MAKIGSLCTGYGGLDLAAESYFNAQTVWTADIDKYASIVIAERFNVPNHGDLTQIDWSTVEPIDILTAGTHVNHLVMLENGKEQMTKDIYGRISSKPLASYDQVSLSWKMSGDTLPSDLTESLVILPKSGITQNGHLYQLQMLAHHTKGKDYSLLPTPTVMHVRNHDEPIEVYQARQARSSTGQIGMSTGVAVRLATPTTNISHTTGKCRNWGADLLHDVKCTCKRRQMHWLKVN